MASFTYKTKPEKAPHSDLLEGLAKPSHVLHLIKTLRCDVEFPSEYYKYVLLPLATKEAVLANGLVNSSDGGGACILSVAFIG